MSDSHAVLFDLDDTLIGNNMDRFLEAYFALLAEYVQELMDGKTFISELLFATQAMISNTDPEATNREVFWSVFSKRTAFNQEDIEQFTDNFYNERFGALENKTQRRPTARKIVELMFARNLPVVIATNPLFPISAIRQRLAWGGVPENEFDYALVTSYENMHSAKPHLSYYQEILDRVGLTAKRTLMVGDDWDNDIAPAKRLGLKTYWIADESVSRPDGIVGQHGSLDNLYTKLIGGWLLS